MRPVVLYITPLVDDDGRVFLYDRTLEFASVLMKNMVGGWKEWLHVFLVHHGKKIIMLTLRGARFPNLEISPYFPVF